MSLVVSSRSQLGVRLREKEPSILNISEAKAQHIRPLHIGFINMMPDAVLERTEDQFLLPLHYASAALQVVPHRIALPGVKRSEACGNYVGSEYQSFDAAMKDGLDGLIITGANISDPDLTKAAFYPALQEVFERAEREITSTLLSCLSTHAYMLHKHGVARQPMVDESGAPKKRWGVYTHHPVNRDHPLVRGAGNTLDMVHSRWNDVSEEQFLNSGMKVLIKSPEAGVHMAVSGDGLRTVCWQGHPEYEDISLLKEFRRDAGEYHRSERAEMPPLPDHYLTGRSLELAEAFRSSVVRGKPMPALPEQEIAAGIQNRWESARTVLLANWVRAVYDITDYARKNPFMPGVDPEHIFNGDPQP